MIKVKNLKKYFANNLVIDDVSFDINEGEIFAIVGHSGAGKSTLLRCLNGLESYESGSVLVDNHEVCTLKSSKLRMFRKEIGMIFQNFALMSQKSVFENVATPLKFWGFKSEYIKERVSELLKLVGLWEKKNAYPNELSGGQKQRVAIARALALKPKILLSDEATSALDPNTTKSILQLLKRINDELKITVVLVTHEMEVVKSIASRAILLEHGKIIAKGRIEELFLKPSEKMKEFLGEDEFLPENGINIRLFFPKEVAKDCVITNMARGLNVDFSIVWGKIEMLNDTALGSLIININEKDKENILSYIAKSGVLWEVVE